MNWIHLILSFGILQQVCAHKGCMRHQIMKRSITVNAELNAGTEEENNAVAASRMTNNTGDAVGMEGEEEELTEMNWACGNQSLTCGHDTQAFRSYSGYCNNIEHPLWGAASIKQERYLPAAYADGISIPRGGWESAQSHCCTGNNQDQIKEMKDEPGSCDSDPARLLPNPRTVRRHFHKTSQDAMVESDTKISLIFTLFAQFVDHDVTLTPEEHAEGCCMSEGNPLCFAIEEPARDTCSDQGFCEETLIKKVLTEQDSQTMDGSLEADNLEPSELTHFMELLNELKMTQLEVLTTLDESSSLEKECFPLTRSTSFCPEDEPVEPAVREQNNIITSFLDASNVYGADPEKAAMLRNGRTAFMRTSDYGLLPDLSSESAFAGDIRSAEQPSLTTMHTLFVREHNRIATKLKHIYQNPEEYNIFIYRDFDRYFNDMPESFRMATADDMIFSMARRIVIWQMQNIVYGQFLTVMLGQETMSKMELNVGERRFLYNKTDNPSIRNEFSTAAYRFGHTMVEGVYDMYNLDTLVKEDQNVTLRENFFSTEAYMSDNGTGCDKLLYGQIMQKAQAYDPFLDENIANGLFENVNDGFGDDLGARNIQRGRDHGIAGYNEYREMCGMERACSWKTAPEEINQTYWDQLSELYDYPSDIDLFTAGLAEKPHKGGVIGRTFNCIISKQFRSIKFGDRFFFTAKSSTTASLEHRERKMILDRSLSDILCDNLPISTVRENVFQMDSPERLCSEGKTLDLRRFITGEGKRMKLVTKEYERAVRIEAGKVGTKKAQLLQGNNIP